MFSSVSVRVGLVLLGVLAVGCAGSDGTEGTQGASALMTASNEPAGKNCPNGGQAVVLGVDRNGDGKLEETEVTGTSFLCNGAVGAQGAAGAEGAAGAQGAPGMDGAAAAKGDPGADGKDGKDGTDGVDGKDGVDGTNGTNGVDGKDGVNGTNGTNGTNGVATTTFGQFLPSQVVNGSVLTCATVSVANGVAQCQGMKLDGLDIYLSPAAANGVCAAVTGKGYNNAGGQGAINGQYMSWKAGNVIALGTTTSASNMSPMQYVYCNM